MKNCSGTAVADNNAKQDLMEASNMKKVGILREQNMYDQITQSHIYGEKF